MASPSAITSQPQHRLDQEESRTLERMFRRHHRASVAAEIAYLKAQRDALVVKVDFQGSLYPLGEED